jgi:hypothetical protein
MDKRKNKGFKPPPSPQSYYNLSEVKQKILNGGFLIKPNAVEEAFKDFGWGISEIVEVYRLLQPKHFYKTDSSKYKPGILIDVYKGNIKGENVYTHFYIDDTINKLVINSFHQI